MLFRSAFSNHVAPVPVVKTIASQKKGIEELWKAISNIQQHSIINNLHTWLMAEKAFHLIEQKRMKGVSKEELKDKIAAEGNTFNLYRFIKNYY